MDKAIALKLEVEKQLKPLDVASLSVGPIDNSDIIEETITQPDGETFTRLKPGSGLQEFELFPEAAWDQCVKWYGIEEGQAPIERTAIKSSPDDAEDAEIIYELHPVIFQIHRLWSELSPLPIEAALKAANPPPLKLVRSRKYPSQKFLKDIKTLCEVPLDRKVRLWSITRSLPAGDGGDGRSALTPPDSPGRLNPQDGWTHLLLDVASFSQARDTKTKVGIQDNTMNEKFNGRSSLQMHELVMDQSIVIDECIDARHWVSTYDGKSKILTESAASNKLGVKGNSRPGSERNSPSPLGPVTRGRFKNKRPGRSLGAVGLQNLGNTCYMNSALQCLRSVEELTKYFLTNSYFEEINKTNEQGKGGKMAISYGNLLRDVFNEGRGSVSPRDLRTFIGRCESAFAGWAQQDSQELLTFLLDTLQEDLNRVVVKKKPFIPKPDFTDEMVNDQNAVKEMANKIWDITLQRDDSVIADLFVGMYKSTLKCPECGKISITFDPFNNLTLSLPVENVWTRTVKFFPLNEPPIKIEVEAPKHSSLAVLKEFISERTGVPAERIIGGEEYKDKFFKIYDNYQAVEEISTSDIAAFHELEIVPTNWPNKGPKKKYRSMLDITTPINNEAWDDASYDRMVVPVFHRRPETLGASESGPPHFICLTREEANDYDTIIRKVLEKVATFSTWIGFRDCYESRNQNGNTSTAASASDGDVNATSSSDADSSGDSKIAARSVDGEDDMVDVTMQDGGPAPEKPPSKLLRHFNTRRPQFMQKDTFLEPEFQNLFDLSYFSSSNDGAVATGWSDVDNSKTLPKVADRVPESSVEDGDGASPESGNGTNSDNEESNEDDSVSRAESSAPTRMVDESSEEEEAEDTLAARRAALAAQQFQRNGPGGRKKFKGHRTYGKKGNKRRDRQMRQANKQAERAAFVKPQPTPAAVADGGPLIRLGEGLVVDWKDAAWERLFASGAKPDEKGTKTFSQISVLADPVLKHNQKRRVTQRTRGLTLDDCLDKFEREEILSEQDMWYCPRCKEHRRASMKLDLWKTPDILIVHLKRFSSAGVRRDKIDVLVDFPFDLDLTTRVINKEDGKQEVFDLIAVDDHFGSLGGGHYTAYAKNFVDGQWYNYNGKETSFH